MEDISLELKNMRALHKLSERYADPEAKMDTPYASWTKVKAGEWNPRLGIVDSPEYEQDQDDKP